MKKILNKYQPISIDTNIFIYYFQKHPQFGPPSKELLLHFVKKQSIITTSIIALIELLSFRATEEEIIKLEHEFIHIAKLDMIDVSREIAREAAKIRREYKFRLPDSIQLATALHSKAQVFITNDQKLKRYKEIKVLTLTDL